MDNLLLESDAHDLFAREELIRAEGQRLTVTDAFAAYVEFCNRRGWAATTRNKFGADIGDVVVRVHGVTIRHDIPDGKLKPQRGWNGLQLREKFPRPTDKKVSEVSETPVSDASDALFPVHSGKIPASGGSQADLI